MDIRTIRPDEWRELRDLRLRALADAPDAFGATYDGEAADSDEVWQLRADRADGTMIVAVAADGSFVGMGSGGPIPDEEGFDGIAAIYGMWVDPTVRGQGLGEGIIRLIADWAVAADYPTIALGVTIGNVAATALYARLGFTDIGRRFPLRDDTELEIQVMAIPLTDLTAYFVP